MTGPDSGYIDATGGYQRVTYDEIETLVFGGDVVVNGTGDDDHMIVTATGEDSGSYVVWTDCGSGFVAGSDGELRGPDEADLQRPGRRRRDDDQPAGGATS